MSKVYIIEGLPGSGKTTMSKRLETYLKSMGKNVQRYSEGDLHPIDLAWCGVTDQQTFDRLCKLYEKDKDQILTHTKKVKDSYITAYTKLKINDKNHNPQEAFAAYSMYKKPDLESFFKAHLKLWTYFGSHYEKDTIYIFECIYLQNHINQLIAKFNLSKKDMIDYFKTLIQPIKALDPVILYIDQQNIKDTIKRLSDERRSPDPSLYKDWIDQVIDYIKTLPYAKTLNYLGYDGFIRYLNDRKRYELDILKTLDIASCIIPLKDDYEDVFIKIKDCVDNN